MEHCPCGSASAYKDCCEPLIKGARNAGTAEELLRARYTAYTRVEMEYIVETTHPDQREAYDLEANREWADKTDWQKLEILDVQGGGPADDQGTVEFIAHFLEKRSRQRHHEFATFVKLDDRWYFEDGKGVPQQQVIHDQPKIGRNEPCPCNSGKKYKKCCGK